MEITAEQYVRMYRDMLRVRLFEFALEREFKRGQVPGMLHTGVGQEATLVAVAQALRPEDGLFPDHRCHGLLFLKGTPGEKIMAELFGKATGVCGGKGGSLHSADAQVNNFGDNAVEGSFMVTALGVGLGWKLQGQNRLVAVMVGDGTSGRGEWHESLNLAAAWKLPVLYCCVNNGYAISTAVGFSHATPNLVDPFAEKKSAWPKVILLIVLLSVAYSLLDNKGLIYEWTSGWLGTAPAKQAVEKTADAKAPPAQQPPKPNPEAPK